MRIKLEEIAKSTNVKYISESQWQEMENQYAWNVADENQLCDLICYTDNGVTLAVTFE